MNDGNRRAPVALARNAPVAQAPHHLFFAQALRREIRRNGVDRGFIVEPAVFAGIQACAVFGVPGLPCVERIRLAVDVDHGFDREAELLRERKIALVVRGHAHHSAVAVTNQYVVADPHFDCFARERMGDEDAGRHALLFHRRQVGFHDGAALAFIDEGGELRIALRRMRGKRMLRRHGAERDAHDGVRARREYPELIRQIVVAPASSFSPARGGGARRAACGGALDRKGKAHAEALADPVRLHGFHALGPARQRVERGQQLVGIFRDRHVVHRDLALLDQRAGAPAAAVDHLLVGQYRLVDGIPVHRAGLLVDETRFEHAQKQPLVPAIIIGLAGCEFAFPVDREAERLQLLLHVRDVVVSPFCGRYRIGHRGVLCGQAESVPAHRLQHVAAAHAVVAGERVAYGIVSHVSHVQLARWIGKHREAIIFGFAGRFPGLERALFVPELLGFALDYVCVIFVLHACLSRLSVKTRIIPATHAGTGGRRQCRNQRYPRSCA